MRAPQSPSAAEAAVLTPAAALALERARSASARREAVRARAAALKAEANEPPPTAPPSPPHDADAHAAIRAEARVAAKGEGRRHGDAGDGTRRRRRRRVKVDDASGPVETPRTATLAQLERDAADASQLRHELKKAHNRERALEEQVKKLQDQVQTLSSQLVDAASTPTNPAKDAAYTNAAGAGYRAQGGGPGTESAVWSELEGTSHQPKRSSSFLRRQSSLIKPSPTTQTQMAPTSSDLRRTPSKPGLAPWYKLEQEGHMRRLSVELRKQETGAYGLSLNDFNAVLDVPPSSSLEQNDLVVEVAGKKLGLGEKLQDCLPAGDTMTLVVLRPLLSVPELQKALGVTPDSKTYKLSVKPSSRLLYEDANVLYAQSLKRKTPREETHLSPRKAAPAPQPLPVLG